MNAIRVPLYLAWGGDRDELAPFAAWGAPRAGGEGTPGWIDLKTGAVADWPVTAVLDLADAVASSRKVDLNPMAAFAGERSYFGASLAMLARLAADDLAAD